MHLDEMKLPLSKISRAFSKHYDTRGIDLGIDISRRAQRHRGEISKTCRGDDL